MHTTLKTVLILLILPLFAFIKADWFSQAIDSKASISFPGKPEKAVQPNGDTWTFTSELTTCSVAIIDMKALGMDSAAVKEMLADPKSLLEFRNGLLGEMKGSTLIGEAESKLGGYPSYEFTVDRSSSKADADKLILYNKNVFVGDKIYGLYYYERKARLQESDRIQFFNSFKVKK